MPVPAPDSWSREEPGDPLLWADLPWIAFGWGPGVDWRGETG